MKDKGLRLFPLILLLAVLPLCMTGCIVTARGGWGGIWVDESHHGHSHAYFYYPDAMVYFDPSVSIYYWSDHGAWHHGPHLPPHIVVHHERRVRFETDADRPYKVHERVIERYHPSPRAPHPGNRPPQFRERPTRPGERPPQHGQRPGHPGENR